MYIEVAFVELQLTTTLSPYAIELSFTEMSQVGFVSTWVTVTVVAHVAEPFELLTVSV